MPHMVVLWIKHFIRLLSATTLLCGLIFVFVYAWPFPEIAVAWFGSLAIAGWAWDVLP